ncbi:MAG TPA: PKD domain-containing protein, partial [Thermoplasmata archaeon]|nr:PKD domain-containing protein [Thermoplasmata archaeon]
SLQRTIVSLFSGSVALSAAAVLLLSVPASGSSAPVALCSSDMYLQASVTQGPVPLLVSFSLEVNWSTNPAVNWSFGDGSPAYLGTGMQFLHPTHRYNGVGSYPATVKVSSGIRTGSCAVVVMADPPQLTAQAAAHPIQASAPALIAFSGSAAGGSSTYTSELWSFSDGTDSVGWNTTHQFSLPGTYSANFTVFDSAGDSAHAIVFVNVSAAAPVHATSAPPTVDPISATAGALAAMIGAALLYAVPTGASGAGRGDEARRMEETDELDSDDTAPLLPEGFAYRGNEPVSGESLYLEHVPPEPGEPIRPLPPPTISELALLTGVPSLPALPAPKEPTVGEAPVAPAPAPEEQAKEANALRLSQRVLLHLYGQGRLGDDEVATPGFTQAGMTDSLDTQQSLLSNVLRRMLYSGYLTQDVRHVRGASRRLRVYRLTVKGERLARELLERIEKNH